MEQKSTFLIAAIMAIVALVVLVIILIGEMYRQSQEILAMRILLNKADGIMRQLQRERDQYHAQVEDLLHGRRLPPEGGGGGKS